MKLLSFLLLTSLCGAATEADLRKALLTKTGSLVLPSGVIEVTRELVVPPDAHALSIAGSQTTIKASAAFRGRALIVITGGTGVQLHGISLDGNRDEVGRMAGPSPATAMMSRIVANNGILAENTTDLQIFDVKALHVAGFAVLINSSHNIHLHDIDVDESGGYNLERHNSGTGGILIEEGTTDFSITRCLLGKIRGNGITLRSLRASPANSRGRIAENEFAVVARDAMQISGASDMVIENNRGRLVGYPVDETDIAGGMLPSGIHTVDRVEKSTLRNNSFDNIDGRCFTFSALAGSEVSGNVCTEQLFGAMVLGGSANHVAGNRLDRMNLAHKETPEQLTAGIYVSASARANRIENNQLSGFGMSRHCVVAAVPGNNEISKNDCSDETDVASRHGTPRLPSFAAAAFPSRR